MDRTFPDLSLDLTVRGISDVEPVLQVARVFAARFALRNRYQGTCFVTVEGVHGDAGSRAFATVRLSTSRGNTESGYTAESPTAAIAGAFNLLLPPPPIARAA